MTKVNLKKLASKVVEKKLSTDLASRGGLCGRLAFWRLQIVASERSVVRRIHGRRRARSTQAGVTEQVAVRILLLLLSLTNLHVEDVVVTRILGHHHLAVRTEQCRVGIHFPISSTSRLRLSVTWPEQMSPRLLKFRPFPYTRLSRFASFAVSQLAFIDWLRTIISSLLRLFCCRVITWQRTVEDRKMPFCIIHLHFGIHLRFFGSFRGPDARLRSVYCRRGGCHLRFLTRNWHRRFSWTISVGNFRCRFWRSSLERPANNTNFLTNLLTKPIRRYLRVL